MSEVTKLMLKEDSKFLGERVRQLRRYRPTEICDGYYKKFIQGMSNEPVEHKKNNAGRHKANSWLRDL